MANKMEIIDRYIYEVGRYLPRRIRGDIQAELRSLILDSLGISEHEEVSEDQVVAVLKEFGPPKAMAASYQPKNQYLIGPELYPLFRLVTGIVLIAVLGALLLAFIIGAITSQEPLLIPQPFEILDYLSELFGALVSTFGMLVLVFIILQRFNVHPELEDEAWDPRMLPPIDESSIVNRTETVIGLAFTLVVLIILWFFPDIIGFVTSWGGPVIRNPVIVAYVPLISLALLLGLALDIVLLSRGRWTSLTRLAKIGTNLLGIYVLYVLIAGHTAWLDAHGAGGFFASIEALSGDATSATQSLGMHAFRLAFFIALIVTSIETIGLIYRLIKQAVLPAVPVAPSS
jgi:hypothetical protein